MVLDELQTDVTGMGTGGRNVQGSDSVQVDVLNVMGVQIDSVHDVEVGVVVQGVLDVAFAALRRCEVHVVVELSASVIDPEKPEAVVLALMPVSEAVVFWKGAETVGSELLGWVVEFAAPGVEGGAPETSEECERVMVIILVDVLVTHDILTPVAPEADAVAFPVAEPAEPVEEDSAGFVAADVAQLPEAGVVVELPGAGAPEVAGAEAVELLPDVGNGALSVAAAMDDDDDDKEDASAEPAMTELGAVPLCVPFPVACADEFQLDELPVVGKGMGMGMPLSAKVEVTVVLGKGAPVSVRVLMRVVVEL